MGVLGKMKVITIAILSLVAVSILLLKIDFFTGIKEPPLEWRVISKGDEQLSHTPALIELFFFDKTSGLSLTPTMLLKTANGGETWTEVLNLSGVGLSSLRYSASNKGWIVGVKGNMPFILQSNGDGLLKDAWHEVKIIENSAYPSVSRIGRLRDVCVTGQDEIWFAGDRGILGARQQNFELIPFDFISTESTVFSIACSGSTGFWAVGDDSAVYTFDKSGWRQVVLTPDVHFAKVKIKGDRLWIIGSVSNSSLSGVNAGSVFVSDNLGKDWRNVTPKDSRPYNDIIFIGETAILLGEQGVIVHSDDLGRTWTASKSGTAVTLLCGFSLDSNDVWAGGHSSTLLKLKE